MLGIGRSTTRARQTDTDSNSALGCITFDRANPDNPLETMDKPLRVLIVEDCDLDAELLLHELARAGYDVTHEQVQTAEAMKLALERSAWDVVLSDYSMPEFSGPAALETLRATGHDLPFIIVS